MRSILADAFMRGLEAVEPRRLVREYPLELRPEAFVAVGKAAPAMAQGALDKWPNVEGVVVTTRGMAEKAPKSLEVYGAGHPLPDEDGLRAASRVEDFLASKKGKVVLLLSGGASALLPSPAPPLELEDLRHITERLLLGGASILELNTVRRHLEMLKGGGLLAATRARLVTLMISDIIGGELWAVASGPTVSGGTEASDARRVLEKYGVAVDPRIEMAMDAKKTHVQGDNRVLADYRTALVASASRLEELMRKPVHISSFPLLGEARVAGKIFSDIVEKHGLAVAGGETVVTVKGSGRGGRNQEMALSALMESRASLLFASTDGADGSTDAAGAFADPLIHKMAQGQKLDPYVFLEENNSHVFFSRTEGLFKTGETGTNVCDLALGVSERVT